MTDHLPECPLVEACNDEIPEHGYCSMQHGMFCIHCHQWCICDALSACEQRVLHKEYLQGDSYRGGYAAGLDAAEAAVLAVSVYRWPYSEPNDKYTECITVDSAIAAIDALKEKP